MKLKRYRLWKQKPKTLLNILPHQLVYRKSSVGCSRIITMHYNPLPLNWKFKHLSSRFLWKAGRSKQGHRILRTRGRVNQKRSYVSINYGFRHRFLTIIAGFFYMPHRRKILSLLYTSAGIITYVPTPATHQLITISRLFKTKRDFVKNYFSRIRFENALGVIKQGFFLISQLPRHKPISLIELIPGFGVKYIRSAGSKGIMVKKDFKTFRGLIKLPSGVRKSCLIYSVGSNGQVALPTKNRFHNPKAGYKVNMGFKSIVRGVAMNPVDHPHGGRTKSIKYPRTPWGQTTKYK